MTTLYLHKNTSQNNLLKNVNNVRISNSQNVPVTNNKGTYAILVDGNTSIYMVHNQSTNTITIFNEKGETRNVSNLIGKAINIAKNVGVKKIRASVLPTTEGIEDLKIYFKKGFLSNVRFENSRIFVSYNNNKTNSNERKKKATNKINGILNNITRGTVSNIKIKLGKDILKRIKDKLTENKEYGGLIQLTNRTFKNKIYSFDTKISQIVEGSNHTFVAPIPSIISKQEVISFHTHPETCYRRLGCILGIPSIQDLIITWDRILAYGDRAHIVFAMDAIFVISIPPPVILWVKSLPQNLQVILTDKFKKYVKKIFNPIENNRFHNINILKQMASNEGYLLSITGTNQNRKYKLTQKNRNTGNVNMVANRSNTYDNYFELMQKINPKNPLQYKRLAQQQYEVFEKAIKQFTINKITPSSFPSNIKNFQIFDIQTIADTTNNSKNLQIHNYNKPLTLNLSTPLVDMKGILNFPKTKTKIQTNGGRLLTKKDINNLSNLGINTKGRKTITKKQIQTAYKSKAMTNHPNKGGSTAEMQKVTSARNRLNLLFK